MPSLNGSSACRRKPGAVYASDINHEVASLVRTLLHRDSPEPQRLGAGAVTVPVLSLSLVSLAPSCSAVAPVIGWAGGDSVTATFGRGRSTGGTAGAAGSCGARVVGPPPNPPAPGPFSTGPLRR